MALVKEKKFKTKWLKGKFSVEDDEEKNRFYLYIDRNKTELKKQDIQDLLDLLTEGDQDAEFPTKK